MGKSSGTMIIKCHCSHPYQDEMYGEGMRVHNPCMGPSSGAIYGRCTVCSTERLYQDAPKKDKEVVK